MPTTNTRSSVRTRRNRVSNGKPEKPSNGSSSKSSTKKSSKPENGTHEGNSQLEKLFTDSLKDIYWAEKHLTKTLPKMKKRQQQLN
jgi:translation initiation factor 2 beta subunit (eIF-2beta)/eIF-5